MRSPRSNQCISSELDFVDAVASSTGVLAPLPALIGALSQQWRSLRGYPTWVPPPLYLASTPREITTPQNK